MHRLQGKSCPLFHPSCTCRVHSRALRPRGMANRDTTKGQHRWQTDGRGLSLPVSPPRVPPHGHSGGIVTPKHSCRRSRATEQHEQRGKKERGERKKVRKASRELHGDDRSPLGQLSSSPAVQEKVAQKGRCRGGGKSQTLTTAQPLHLLQTHKRRSYSLAAPQSCPLMPPPRVPREAKAGGVFSYGSGYSS